MSSALTKVNKSCSRGWQWAGMKENECKYASVLSSQLGSFIQHLPSCIFIASLVCQCQDKMAPKRLQLWGEWAAQSGM